MAYTFDEVQPLLVLQQVDLEILQRKKQLDALPQRAQIAALRQKRASVQEKADQIAKMLAAVDVDLEHKRFEDAQLAEKQDAAQAQIEAAQGDYRSVGALTKELEGFSERREKVAEAIQGLEARKAEVQQVEAKATAALRTLDEEEARQVASFQEEGGALTEAIAQAQASRDELAKRLDADLVARYEKSAKRFGGVGVARLDEQRCSACRNRIEENRMPQLRREAPLSTCPACGRLLIV